MRKIYTLCINKYPDSSNNLKGCINEELKKLKQRFLLIWYYLTFQKVGYKAMTRELMSKQSVGFFLRKMFSKKESWVNEIRRKYFEPKFGKCLRNIIRRRNKT